MRQKRVNRTFPEHSDIRSKPEPAISDKILTFSLTTHFAPHPFASSLCKFNSYCNTATLQPIENINLGFYHFYELFLDCRALRSGKIHNNFILQFLWIPKAPSTHPKQVTLRKPLKQSTEFHLSWSQEVEKSKFQDFWAISNYSIKNARVAYMIVLPYYNKRRMTQVAPPVKLNW